MVLGIFSTYARAHQKGPPFSTFRLAGNPFIEHPLKGGLAFGFTHPLLKEPIKIEFISHIPVFFLDLRPIIADSVERVMTFCRNVLIRWMFPSEIGSKFRSCHYREELAAVTEWKFNKSTR